MIESDFQPKQLHLVLIGGGHAHVQVLKSFAMRPVEGLAITLISDVLYAPYSGMLPGFVEGVWRDKDLHFDLQKLASFAGASLIHAPATAIDAKNRLIHMKDRPPLGYDILSLNCGAAPELDNITGAKTHAIAVKPIAHFLAQLPERLAPHQPINIIGAGVAGLELAFALKARYDSQHPEINVFSRSQSILSQMPKQARQLAQRIAEQRGIHIHNHAAVRAISQTELTTTAGDNFASGLNFVVTGVKAPAFIASLDAALSKAGFVQVTDSLQSEQYPEIFAAGDVADIRNHPREKAGVFAVRAGAILAENLRRYVYNKPLKRWRPQKHYLALIGTGDGKAIAIRNGLAYHNSLFWKWKCHIDKTFMAKFNDLPQMSLQAPHPLPRYHAQGYNGQDPIFEAMRCAGCAAKASASLLETAMTRAISNASVLGCDPALLSQQSSLSEDAGMTPAIAHDLRHSFDSLTQMVPDPFIFAQIAVIHALSDLYVAGATPLYAQAHITLEEASETYQGEIASQLLTGSLVALGKANSRLIGGHTSQSRSPSLGFAVTGAQTHSFAPYEAEKDYQLVMTKKLGVGTALAAHMRQKLPARLYHEVCASMLISNQKAAEIAFEHNVIAMTDITGFGLARHARNLLSRLSANTGLQISLSTLPFFDGIEQIISDGVRSSLFDKNKQAGDIIASPSAYQDWRLPLLFDPQTSGGILALVPATQTDKMLQALANAEPDTMAVCIGAVSHASSGIIVEV